MSIIFFLYFTLQLSLKVQAVGSGRFVRIDLKINR